MARTYRSVDRDQEFLLPPDIREWLPPDHAVWFLIEAVEHMDTTAFHKHARLGGTGRRGYDPDMILTVFVYALAQGISSSRQIEQHCHTDIAFRIICAQDAPDHTVLARFRQRHETELKDFLTETLVLAARLGMLKLGVIALDGVKISAHASKDANRTETSLRKLAEEYVDTVTETDDDDDDTLGPGNRGDELPAHLRDRTDRAGRIKKALTRFDEHRAGQARDDALTQKHAREHLQNLAAGRGRTGPRRGTDPVAAARVRYERVFAEAKARHDAYQAECAALGKRPPKRAVLPPEEYAIVRYAKERYEKKVAEADHAKNNPSGATSTTKSTTSGLKVNVTDPDSRVMKSKDGWVQGVNCQDSATEDLFILTAKATQAPNDLEQFIPAIEDITTRVKTIAERSGRIDLTVGTLLADAGYSSEENLSAQGPDRLIADGARHDMEKRAKETPHQNVRLEDQTERQKMSQRLATEEGLAIYRKRAYLVETVHAWIKDRRGLRRFSRRGLSAMDAEFSFAAAVTNLMRLRVLGATPEVLRHA